MRVHTRVTFTKLHEYFPRIVRVKNYHFSQSTDAPSVVKDVKMFETSSKGVLLIRILSVRRNPKARGKTGHVLILFFRAQRPIFPSHHSI